MIFPLALVIPMLAMLAFDGLIVVAWTALGWGLLFILHVHLESHANYMRRMRGRYPVDYDRI